MQNFAVTLGYVESLKHLKPLAHASSTSSDADGGIRWMVTWICLLAITVVVQRRRKEAGKMRAKWDEMKRVDEKRMAGEAR